MNRSYFGRKSAHDTGVCVFFRPETGGVWWERGQMGNFPPQAAKETKIAAKHLTINSVDHRLCTFEEKVCGNPFVCDASGRFYHLKELLWDEGKPIISLLVRATDDRWSFRGVLEDPQEGWSCRKDYFGRVCTGILKWNYWDFLDELRKLLNFRLSTYNKWTSTNSTSE